MSQRLINLHTKLWTLHCWWWRKGHRDVRDQILVVVVIAVRITSYSGQDHDGDLFVIRKWSWLVSPSRGTFEHDHNMLEHYCIINWLIIMILFVIMIMPVVSLQVHSMDWPGVSCQISGKSCWKGVMLESRSCPHRCPYAMEFRYDVVPLPRSCYDRGPFMFTK